MSFRFWHTAERTQPFLSLKFGLVILYSHVLPSEALSKQLHGVEVRVGIDLINLVFPYSLVRVFVPLISALTALYFPILTNIPIGCIQLMTLLAEWTIHVKLRAGRRTAGNSRIAESDTNS